MKKFDQIIIISLDTLRADCIGASPKAYNFSKKYNIQNAMLKTQVLDKILNKSAYYNNCFTSAWYTTASHACYFTWCRPKNHWVFEFFNRPLQKETIFQHAKKYWYTTIFQTDFPIILGKYLWFDRDIDNYYIEAEDEAFTKLQELWEQKTMSFFHFWWIHYPYGFHIHKYGKEDYVKKVEELEKKYNLDVDTESQDKFDESYRTLFDKILLKRYKNIVTFMYENWLYDDLFYLYIEWINYFFEHRFNMFLKKIIDFVDNKNALLVIFADHGEWWNKECYWHYNSLEHDILNVPLLFYGKGIPSKIHNSLIRSIDLTPTIMSLLDDKNNIPFDGKILDIFDKWRISEEWRIAIAQYRMNRDINEYHKFHEEVLKAGVIEKSLVSTCLAAETIFDKEYKMMNNFNKENDVVATTLFKQLDDWTTEKVKENSFPRTTLFKDMLKDYNNTNIFIGKDSTIDDVKFKEYFNDLWYNI